MRFTKVESIGNDFVLMEGPLDDPSAIALKTSPRRWSIGSDGLLVIERPVDNIVPLRMFNPDGTEDFCGNGLRCAALYAHRQGWVGDKFVIRHLGQDVRVESDGATATTYLAPASFDPLVVPTSAPAELWQASVEGLVLSSLSTGSTHTVILVESLPDESTIAKVGELLEHLPLFPERTSVIWARGSGSHLDIKIWERGAGETLGCGTGSAAAAVVWARLNDLHDAVITVHNPGGTVMVSMKNWQSEIALSGEAHVVYEGHLS